MTHDKVRRKIRGSQSSFRAEGMGIQTKKFIHCLMSDGKRRLAERIFDAALDMARRKIRRSASVGQILSGAVENMRPLVEIRRCRVGGIEYKVPAPLSDRKSRAIAIRTIVEEAHNLTGHRMASRLAKAILASYKNRVSHLDTI